VPVSDLSRWCASCTRRGATRSTRPSTCTASSSTGIESGSTNASTTCSRPSCTAGWTRATARCRLADLLIEVEKRLG